MSLPFVLEHIDLIAAAPEGVKRLRELILELAVRGKLVPQDPNDEPAGELLKRIQAEKTKLVAEGRIKKDKPLPEIGEEEKPFELPAGWEWVRLGAATTFGQADKSDGIDDSTWVLDLEDIEKDTSVLLQKIRFADRPAKSDKNQFQAGDVLYGKLRPYLNKVIVADEGGVCTTEILPVRGYGSLIYARYLMHALKRPDFLAYVNAKSYGMKMPRLGTDDGRMALFPLPPLAEQHRIVAKVDELMALCDRLEAQQADAASAHATLVKALLDTLAQSQSATDFTANWQRLAQHFDTLFTTEASIDALKQTVLQLAYSGLLTGSDASKWLTVRLSDITDAIADIDHKMPKAVSEGVIFLSAKDLKDNGTLDFSQPKYISREDFERLSKRICPKRGDIIYSRIGARLGKARLVEVDTEFLVSYSCCVVRPNSERVDRHYLVKFLDSRLALDQAHLGKQSIGVPDLGLGVIKAFEVPLPPLSEQHRIVSKTDELLVLCDQLAARLKAARELATQYATAAAKAVLEAA
jgi:type I restriction enzyme S subunit